eukprot:360166-Chlamydomonas_euryale.AAC.5
MLAQDFYRVVVTNWLNDLIEYLRALESVGYILNTLGQGPAWPQLHYKSVRARLPGLNTAM